MSPGGYLVIGLYGALLAGLMVGGFRSGWASKYQRSIAWSLIPGGLGLVLFIGLKLDSNTTEADVQAQPVKAALLAPVRQTHFYSVKDGDDYGYEAASSDADKNLGLKAKPLIIFRYLGRKGDTYQVVMIDDKFRNVFEVSKPFEFAKIHSFYNDRYEGKELMRIEDGTVAAAAIQDAMSGHMKQWTRVERGVVTTLWVDAEKKKLMVEAAEKSGVMQ